MTPPLDGSDRPRRRGLGARVRTLLVAVIAAAVVVAGAFALRATADDPTATTRLPNSGQTSASPSVLAGRGAGNGATPSPAG
jgi:hypothetical protein